MTKIKTVSAHTASLLLQVGAVKLSPENPYTWSSGWKSPIYCDNRLTLSYPEIRTYLKEELAALLKTHFPGAEAIAGVATAGIPHAALVADALDMPMCYVRSAPKAHGMGNRIEGLVLPGQQVVVLEDLISTGGSSLSVVETLWEAGAQVLGMLAIFTYGFETAAANFRTAGCPWYTLTDYPTLLAEALGQGLIQPDALEQLNAWRNTPDTWRQ